MSRMVPASVIDTETGEFSKNPLKCRFSGIKKKPIKLKKGEIP